MRIHGLLGLVAAGVLSATALAEAPVQRGVELIVPGNDFVKQWERDGYDQLVRIGVETREHGGQVIVAELRINSWSGYVGTVAEVELGAYEAPLLAFEGDALPELVSLADMRSMRVEPLLVDAILELGDVQFPIAEGNGILTPCEAMVPFIFYGAWQQEGCSVSCLQDRDRCIWFELICEDCTRVAEWCPGGAFGSIANSVCTCTDWVLDSALGLEVPVLSFDCPSYMDLNSVFIWH